MKYQFNEQELLSLFYNKENDLCSSLTAPYLKNGYVCASEGHILIRIKAEMLHEEYKEITRCNIDLPADNCNFIVSLKEIEKTLSSIPQVVEKVKVGEDIKCMECDGVGKVEWEYQDRSGHYHYEDHECPICEGSGFDTKSQYVMTGRMIPDGECAIEIRRIAFKAKFIEVLSKAMRIIGIDEVQCVHQAYAKPCIFRVDNNIEIIIMPCLADAKYRIRGRRGVK